MSTVEEPGSPEGATAAAISATRRARVRWIRGIGIPLLLFTGIAFALPHMLQDYLMYFPRRYQGKPPGPVSLFSRFEPYTTADGLAQWGQRIYPPPGAPHLPAQLPDVYLVFYGNGSLASEMGFFFAPIAVETGAGFFIVDYRGYGFNPGRPTEAGLTADAIGAYDTLKAAGTFQRGVGVIGHSMGAAAALALAEVRHVDRLLLIAPFTSIRDMARETMPLPVALIARDGWPNERRLAGLLARPDGERPSAIAILHGARDEIIPVGMGRRLASLPGPPVELRVLENSGHNDLSSVEIVRFIRGQALTPSG